MSCRLVTEGARAAEERDTRLVPRARDYRALALGTVDSEEVERLVVGVGKSEGHHDVAEANVCPVGKRLLHPELLQLHLAALLGLGLPFAAFLGFLLDGSAAAAVLELYLHAHGPSLAEVVAHVKHGVGNVKPPVRGVVLIIRRVGVAEGVVAVEVARIRYLAVSADAQAVALGVGVHAVRGRHLRPDGRCGEAKCQRAHGKHCLKIIHVVVLWFVYCLYFRCKSTTNTRC